MHTFKTVACSLLLAATAMVSASMPAAWAHCNDWRDYDGYRHWHHNGYWHNPGYQPAYYSNNGNGLLGSIFGGNNYYRPQPRWNGYSGYRGYGWGPPPNARGYYRHAWYERHEHGRWGRDWDRDWD